MSSVKIGGIYEHYKRKTLYRVLGIGHLETAPNTLAVFYAPLKVEPGYRVWVRTVEDFEQLMNNEDTGEYTDRFRLVRESKEPEPYEQVVMWQDKRIFSLQEVIRDQRHEIESLNNRINALLAEKAQTASV